METEAAEVACPSLEKSSNKQPMISNVFAAILFIAVAIQFLSIRFVYLQLWVGIWSPSFRP